VNWLARLGRAAAYVDLGLVKALGSDDGRRAGCDARHSGEGSLLLAVDRLAGGGNFGRRLAWWDSG